MNILFTICGRAGSKGIKNKNLKDFLGFPLPFYTISVIDLFIKNNSDYSCDVVLNTDSLELIKLFEDGLNYPIEIIERDKTLGLDDTPKIKVIENSYILIKTRLNKDYDMVIDLDITSPLRTLDDVESLVEKKKNNNADVIFSVTTARRNPYFNMVMKTKEGYKRVIKSNYNTRQQAPEIFDMNASMYAYTPDFLISGKGIFEGKMDIIKMVDTAVLDIDYENDFILMEVIARHLFAENESFNTVRNNINMILVD